MLITRSLLRSILFAKLLIQLAMPILHNDYLRVPTLEAAYLPLNSSDLKLWQMISNKLITIDSQSHNQGLILSPGYPNSAPIGSRSTILLQINNLPLRPSQAINASSGQPYDQPSYDAIRLSIEELSLQTANTCTGEAVNVYLLDNDEILYPTNIIYTFCGSQALEPVLVVSSKIVIQFVSDEFAPLDLSDSSSTGTHPRRPRRFKIKFEFLHSDYQLYNGCDEPNQFKCRNRRCISNDLLCNHFDDCGDASDEDRYTPCAMVPTIAYRNDYKCGLAKLDDFDRRYSGETFPADRATDNLLQNRIVGGTIAQAADRRLSQVSIQLIGIEPMSHICGGVLIHPLFVLTSAHCFRDNLSAYNYKLLFGLQDLRHAMSNSNSTMNNRRDNTYMDTHHQLRYASFIRLYPQLMYSFEGSDFADGNLDKANKLALVELNAPITMNSHIWPACLPHLGETIQAERECMIAGYGETRGTGYPFALKRTIQTIQLAEKCHSEYSEIQLDDYSMICATNEPAEGPCNGDSGGPLLCRDDSDNIPVNISDPIKTEPAHLDLTIGEPGDIIKYLEIVDTDSEDDDDQGGRKRVKKRNRKNSDLYGRYTVHGITSFTTDGNMGGGFCAVKGVPVIYGRVSTRVEWILSVMKMALPRLNKADQSQDKNNQTSLFGYMFRTGQNQHINFTRSMTV